ncbi:hypothetical protein IAU60_001394 [Kwoniella sp. DSM 27419]
MKAQSAVTFKDAIYHATGVPVERMKVMVKGGILKDETDMSSLGLKQVIGTAGPLPSAPVEKLVFLEDLDDGQRSLMAGTPPGLINLGQTCYLNSTMQALRSIPRLRESLRDLSQTADALPPFALLNHLRSLAPQFAEQDNHGNFSQQDADEAWTQVVSALRSSTRSNGGASSFIDDVILQCVEAPDEPPVTTKEKVLKLECNISISTNFLMSGLLDGLNQQIEKTSLSLGRMAQYTQDIQKKAKIMRKVKYPLQLDVTDMVTDELRQQIQSPNAVAKQILKDRDDRAKVAKHSAARGKGDSSNEEEIRKEERDRYNAAVGSVAGAGADGTNPSGLYELWGHYIGWTRKEDQGMVPSGEEEWYKYDDDKVSVVKADKILSMDGGGEDSVAYILLYRVAGI